MGSPNSNKRIVVTGMGINTPIGDSLDLFYDNLIAGKSAITRWKFFDTAGVYSKIGGDLSGYNVKAKIGDLSASLPSAMHKRMRKLVKKAPFSTQFSCLVAADAWADAGLTEELDPLRCATLIGGHNLGERFILREYDTFLDEPDYINNHAALLMLDTDHAGSVSEVLGWKGAAYTMGGACASSNIALRNAIDEIKYHDHDVAMVVGGILDYSDMGLHAMALLGAITVESFNDEPHRASRPYDTAREGFVPCHGAAALVLEDLDHALARGARIYGEVLGAVSTSDGSHLPSPSPDGQARTIEKLLRVAGVRPTDVNFVCAHATSTPLGDLSEVRALKRVFGDHAYHLKINAPKSMLGHCCWSAPAVETVAGLLQMSRGKLHPSVNIENMDPEVDLDVCPNVAQDFEVRVMLKNSFGFGGLNCCALYRPFDPSSV